MRVPRIPAASRRMMALAGLLLGLAMAGGCKTVREEIRPVRETTLTTARSGDDVTISWIGTRGVYYTVMAQDGRGTRAQWKPLEGAINIRAVASGEPIIVKDRVHPSVQRYYRLVQNQTPINSR